MSAVPSTADLRRASASITSMAWLTGFAVTGVATTSTGTEFYCSSACFFRAANIERIFSSIWRALSRSSSISCGVSRFGAVGGSAIGFGCFGMVDSIAERTAKCQSARRAL
jgi:hypothetical protein